MCVEAAPGPTLVGRRKRLTVQRWPFLLFLF